MLAQNDKIGQLQIVKASDTKSGVFIELFDG